MSINRLIYEKKFRIDTRKRNWIKSKFMEWKFLLRIGGSTSTNKKSDRELEKKVTIKPISNRKIHLDKRKQK